MNNPFVSLMRENVASIRDIQKNPSRSLRGITRVMRGSKTVGFFLSNEEMDDLLEDLEAASSSDLRVRVKKVRYGLKNNQKIALSELAKKYEL